VAEKQTEALEKLNRGIQETKYAAQQQTIELAQGYLDDSTKTLKQQIKEDRATLKDLPDQIPGGREEVFQGMFQELMENFTAMEECIDKAQKNVSDLDPEQIRRQGEVDATDAARRDARELGIDITEIEGTGSDGRVTVDDVKNFAEAVEGGVAGEEGELDASDAARREAEELGVDLSQVEGSGPGGLVTVKDVTSLGEESEDQATGQAGQAAQGARDAAGQAAGQAQQVAGQVAGQAQDAAGGAAQQAQDTAGQVTDQAGQAVQGVQDTVGGLTGGGDEEGQGGGGPLGGVTDQVGQAAQGVQDTAGQVAGQAQDAAGGAAQQAQDAAGQATQQAEQATGGDGAEEPRATNAARRKAEELGVDLSRMQGSGAGGLITIKDVTGS